MEVFVGANIVELKKKTLEDLNSNTIKKVKNERNCWLHFVLKSTLVLYCAINTIITSVFEYKIFLCTAMYYTLRRYT